MNECLFSEGSALYAALLHSCVMRGYSKQNETKEKRDVAMRVLCLLLYGVLKGDEARKRVYLCRICYS